MNDNTPLAVDTGRGLSINYRGKSLYSKYNPSKNSEKIANDAILKSDTLYFIPSPLLLYGLDIILNKLPESSFIICIEVDQSLMKISMDNSEHVNNESCRIVRLDKREQLKLLIEDIGVWKFRRCEMISLNNGFNINKEKYNYLYEFSSFLISTFWRNRLTINKLGKLWIKNILSNLQNDSELYPENYGKPVVICGAGASLEDSLSILKSKRESIYIMAVDTALNPLLEYGIEPDIVFALESQFYNLGDFYNSKGKKIDLFTDITGYPPVCRNLNGNTYFFSSEFFENRLLERISRERITALKIPPLGSVGVAAVYTALELFNEKIFITGLDFSFIPGKSHSKGSPFFNTMLQKSDRVHPAGSYNIAMNRKLLRRKGKGNNAKILTDSVLETYAKLLIDIISQENRVYDLSSTGYPLGAIPTNLDDVEYLFRCPKILENNKLKSDSLFDSTSFYENEIKILHELVLEWDSFNKSDLNEIPMSLITKLEKVDYVYIDFPDRLPHPVKDVSFVSRAVKSARDYIELINNLLR